ncbi:MAG: HlyD family efflux transporter periplasmic adaptor subunit [Hoeflea sp.]|uniref:HlyD family efflux transporter periplasmic adaptor subunit n=1 Tax=Hoeflea sp. TaxID=1940281 RepID=UPI001D9E2492|nr:HlyD family efflux transporter periplasmic adaptor subunit [Hoeflea sp.]MBU4528392.1 HlyD family efflux transporter periplasmic adaptor subunit [Alphaproteobacteria bacterium]MBU4543061.1 HlyD family efflux transporter periplasmic adaptor subunit [Alphaproteobacteria bacterium]MBU4551752.1 HlyD family efflux transporter periplasmic adaptor subunit [Alphaproteobacteria bacterium]MBV1723647.1 HlyD family efflux transporter periplasmic adaptor subunit [Hoeflea sp.]MBV1761963.1 HlyD family effl
MTVPPDADLPLHVVGQEFGRQQVTRRRLRFHKRYLLVFLIPVFMFSGGVIGMYYQPVALQKFYALTGLQPGGGATKPIALPPDMELPKEMAATMQATDVVGLARLTPRGDVSIVAPPYGAGDARIAEVLVSIGDRVEKGAVVARLDNRGQLEGAVLQAQANVAVREAALVQTTESVKNSQAEALAALEQARSTSMEAAAELERSKALFDRGVITQASLDSLVAAERQAGLAVQKAEATLSRFASQEAELQPDVIVAARNLDAAKADLARAEQDLIRSAVLAPISGVVLDSMANPGERPPSNGIMQIGDTDQMMAEVEVYQDRIANVAVGQPVELAAVAIGQTLQGRVKSIGLTVGRQGLLSDDTAANTDARVIKVMVELDAASSRVAARYTNLEVIARIDTRTLAPAAKSNP